MRLLDNQRDTLEEAQQQAAIAAISLKHALARAGDGYGAAAAGEIADAREAIAEMHRLVPLLAEAERRAKRMYGKRRAG